MSEAYLDAITSSYFKTRDDGTKVFYPQGAIGRVGYIVSSPELEDLLRQRAKRFFVGSMLGGPLLGGCLGELANNLQLIPVVVLVAMLLVIRVFGAVTFLLLLVSLGSVISPRDLPHWSATLIAAGVTGILSVVTHRMSKHAGTNQS